MNDDHGQILRWCLLEVSLAMTLRQVGPVDWRSSGWRHVWRLQLLIKMRQNLLGWPQDNYEADQPNVWASQRKLLTHPCQQLRLGIP